MIKIWPKWSYRFGTEPSSQQVRESIEMEELAGQPQIVFSDKGPKSIRNLKQIPGYEKLLAHKLAQEQQQPNASTYTAE